MVGDDHCGGGHAPHGEAVVAAARVGERGRGSEREEGAEDGGEREMERRMGRRVAAAPRDGTGWRGRASGEVGKKEDITGN